MAEREHRLRGRPGRAARSAFCTHSYRVSPSSADSSSASASCSAVKFEAPTAPTLPGADELVEGAAASPPAARPGRSRGRGRARRDRRRAARGSSRAGAGCAARRGPRSAPAAIGLNVFVVTTIRSRTSASFVAQPLADELLAAAAAVGVRGVERRDAEVPRPRRAAGTPPRAPSPGRRTPAPSRCRRSCRSRGSIRETATSLRPRARCSTGRSYAASVAVTPRPEPRRDARVARPAGGPTRWRRPPRPSCRRARAGARRSRTTSSVMSVGTFDARFGQAIQSMRSGKIAPPRAARSAPRGRRGPS